MWIDRPCVTLNKNGISFNREAVKLGLVVGAAIEVLLDEDKRGTIGLRLIDEGEAVGAAADRAWIVQRNGSGEKNYGTRLCNRVLAETIGEAFWGSCSTLEKDGSLIIAQFRPNNPHRVEGPETPPKLLPAACPERDQPNLESLQETYPDDMIVEGSRNACKALGRKDIEIRATPIEIVQRGNVQIKRFRVRDLRRWHAENVKDSPWAKLYEDAPVSVS